MTSGKRSDEFYLINSMKLAATEQFGSVVKTIEGTFVEIPSVTILSRGKWNMPRMHCYVTVDNFP